MRQYKVGDRVQVVDCAHPIWEPLDNGTGRWQRRDMSPELMNQIGTIDIVSNSIVENMGRGVGIKFDNGRYVSWFYDWQLKLVEKAEYRILFNFCQYMNLGFDDKIHEFVNGFLNEQDGNTDGR